ncbi:MAG: hypothetical protein CVV13_03905 [Gammaproteobacteria bacterium HGW-Gammaproteobacteria-3]|nr:MAG: hypothetical protein CVV13_03905 [Gammaproteobacteria bacterium HGW-Gammaproteobacteria-3]
MKTLLIALLITQSLVIQGCANHLPTAIQNAPTPDLTYHQVISGDPAKQRGLLLRWGGTVIDVENLETLTRIQVLYYPLDSNGRPQITRPAEGRFILESPLFLDPAIYYKDAEITVVGLLNAETVLKVGDKTLKLPLISAKTLYLWPERDNNGYRGYYPYPYYRPYPYGFYSPYYYPYY